jgi:hypothetical protein
MYIYIFILGSSKVGNTLLELYMEQLQFLHMNTNNENTDIRNRDIKNTDIKNTDIQNTDIRNTDLSKGVITDTIKGDILEMKIMRILKGGYIYNSSHALLLCTSFGFKEGQIYLYERYISLYLCMFFCMLLMYLFV